MIHPSGTDRTIAAYAEAIASGEPTPGGGSVVATTAAFAAGLGEMVSRLTLERAQDAEAEEHLRETLSHLIRLRHSLLDLATADERAYAAYRAALALPKATPEEQADRRAAIERALHDAARVPLAVAQACAGLLTALVIVGRYGTKHALTDVQTAAYLADAALRGALLFVEVNANLLRDRALAAEFAGAATQCLEQGQAAYATTLAAIGERQGMPTHSRAT